MASLLTYILCLIEERIKVFRFNIKKGSVSNSFVNKLRLFRSCTNNNSLSLKPNIDCAYDFLLGRDSTAPRCGNCSSGAEERNQRLDSTIGTQSGACQGSEGVDSIDAVYQPVFLKPTDPSCHASIMSGGDASCRVESLTR